MTEPKKGEFVVRCIMCGNDFRVGEDYLRSGP